LYGNRLKYLPQDLSALESVEIFDISNNLIKNVSLPQEGQPGALRGFHGS